MNLKSLFRPSGELQIDAGLRILLLFSVPLLISYVFFDNGLGINIALGGYPLILADVALFYHTRFQSMLAITVMGALAVFLGSLIAKIAFLKIIATFFWLFASGYLSVYGHLGVMVGIVISLFFLFAINLPQADFHVACFRAGVVIAGAMWAMILCLGLWPIQPFKPLKNAAAGCYQAIADYLKDFRKNYFLEDINSHETEKALSLRQTIQQARDALSSNRQGRLGRSPMGELTSILIEEADCLITQIISFVELVEIHKNYSQFVTINILIYQALEQISIINKKLSKLIFQRPTKININQLCRIQKALEQQKALHKISSHPDNDDYSGYVAIERLTIILNIIIKKIKEITELIEHFDPKKKPKKYQQFNFTEPSRLSWLLPLQDNWTLKSNLFRHALRLGIITSIGVLIESIFSNLEGFWITLTIVLVLQPNFGKTFERFFHRVIGTILGAIFAPLLFSFIQIRILLYGIIIISLSAGITLLKYHYAIGVFFISLFVVKLGAFDPGVEGWNVALMRIGCTLIGAGLAFIAPLVLFPESEQNKLSQVLAKAIETSRNYFLAVMDVYLGKQIQDKSLIGSYKQENKISYFNAQAALQTVVTNPKTKTCEIEPAITLMSYLSRFNRTITVLFVQIEYSPHTNSFLELEEFVRRIDQLLTDLARAIAQQNLPNELPDLDEYLVNIKQRLDSWQQLVVDSPDIEVIKDYTLITTELEAMVDRLKIMYSAVLRLNSTKFFYPLASNQR